MGSDQHAIPGLWTLGLFLLLSSGINEPAQAHDFKLTEALIVFKTDGTYLVDLRMDIDARVAGVSSSVPNEEVLKQLKSVPQPTLEERVERTRLDLARTVRLRFDGEKQQPYVTFPDYGTPLLEKAEPPTLFGTTVRMTGFIPKDAREFTFGASASFLLVHLTLVDQGTGQVRRDILHPSQDSEPFLLGEAAAAAEAALSANTPAPKTTPETATETAPTVAPSSTFTPGVTTPVENRWEVFREYLYQGYVHILPEGYDHVLFVLGLFFLGTQLRPLFWQVTAFTLAHSVTLALSIYGIVELPGSIVEPLIALSIAYVAFENLWTTELKVWRPILVFAFGLLHGLGFAGVLRGLHLPRSEFLTCVISFNLGVEAGQISVILLALLAVGWFRHKPWYRPYIAMPASVVIGCLGLLFWYLRIMESG